jgi:hypothetical protein
MLKKKGMKTTGKKATLMKRLHMRGGKMVMATAEDVKNGVKDKDGKAVRGGKGVRRRLACFSAQRLEGAGARVREGRRRV